MLQNLIDKKLVCFKGSSECQIIFISLISARIGTTTFSTMTLDPVVGMCSITHAEVHIVLFSCWALFIRSVSYADCSLSWVSLFWVLWCPGTKCNTIMNNKNYAVAKLNPRGWIGDCCITMHLLLLPTTQHKLCHNTLRNDTRHINAKLNDIQLQLDSA